MDHDNRSPQTTTDGHRWHLMVNVPKHEIVGKFVDGSTRRVRATWRGWRDGETGKLLEVSPVRWRTAPDRINQIAAADRSHRKACE